MNTSDFLPASFFFDPSYFGGTPTTTTTPVSQAVKVFYVLRCIEGGPLGRLLTGKFTRIIGDGFYSADDTPDKATQFGNIAGAVNARDARHKYNVSRDNACRYEIVRIEQTTVKGKSIPSKTVRTLAGGSTGGAKFALGTATAKTGDQTDGFYSNEDCTVYLFTINETPLFASEQAALRQLQVNAKSGHFFWSQLVVIPVHEQITPTSNEPDTVTFKETVIA